MTVKFKVGDYVTYRAYGKVRTGLVVMDLGDGDPLRVHFGGVTELTISTRWLTGATETAKAAAIDAGIVPGIGDSLVRLGKVDSQGIPR